MKRLAKFVLGSIATLSLIFMAKVALANVSVEVSSNNAGSSSNVSINNNVVSNSNSQTTSKTKTDIRIESNGELKEYHSEDGGSVSIESSDGKAKVNVNSQTNSQNTNSQSSSSSTDSSKAEIKEIQEMRFDILEFIKEKLFFFPFFGFSFFK